MIDLLDRAIETTPELENDYIGDIIKKIQKPADKVRAYAASVGLPENQIVLPFQVLAALYEFNLNNGLRLNETDYLETITKCAYKTVDFILATNNYFGDIESYAIPIQLHIDGLFIRNLINIIVSYFSNLLPEVQQNMRRMLLFQLTQTIFNLGKGDKSILTPVLKQSELFQNVLKNKRGGAGDDIAAQSQAAAPDENWSEFGVSVEEYNDESIPKKYIEVPDVDSIKLDYTVPPLHTGVPEAYEDIEIYGTRLPPNMGAEDVASGTFNILDLSSEKAANNFRDLLQSYLNREYNRNPNARRLIDSIHLKVYHDNDGFLHIDGLPQPYLKYVNQAVEQLLPRAPNKTYYLVPAKNFNSRSPKAVTEFKSKPYFIEKRNPQQGPNLPRFTRNFWPSDSDPHSALMRQFYVAQRDARYTADEAEEREKKEKDAALKAEQQKVRQLVAEKRAQIKSALERLAAFDKKVVSEEEINNLLDKNYRVSEILLQAKAGQFVIDSLNTTDAYAYDRQFSTSMEFLSNLDEIANTGNFTTVYKRPSLFNIISYEALGFGLIQSAYWWNNLVGDFFNAKAIEEVYRDKTNTAQELVKQLRMGETKDDYVKLNSNAVQAFEQAMQTNDEIAQGVAAQALLDTLPPEDKYMSKADIRRLANLPVDDQTEALYALVPAAIKDGVEVTQAVIASQNAGRYDDLKSLLGVKLLKWGGTAALFFSGTYFVWKGVDKAWKRITGNAFNLQHIDPQVFYDFGWPINATETQEQFSGDHITRIDALAIYFNRLVSDASIAAGMLPKEIIDRIEEESKLQHYPFHFKCMLYINAAGLYNEFIINNTPKIPELFEEQFNSVLEELQVYENTSIPDAIVTLEAENAFYAHLETHIDNLPLIQRMVKVLEELDKLYKEYDKVAKILEEQKSAFPIQKELFREALDASRNEQLGRLKKEKDELDKRYNAGVAELSKEYNISKEEVDTLLRSSTKFEDVAKAFTKVTVNQATKEANENLQKREQESKTQIANFEERSKKYITDWGLNWLRNFFFVHSEHGWDNKFEKFIEAGNIHNSIGLATSILAFLCGFGGGIGYLKSLWSDEQPGWIVQMLLVLGSAFVTYISASTVAAFNAIGVAPWLSIAIASVIGAFFSLGITGRIAVTTAVKLWKGFKAGSLLWRWASGKAGISEEKADAIAEAASIGATALTGALSNGFSELLSPLKLPNAAVNLGSQILPRPMKPLLAPIKTITEPLSNFADRRIKANTSKMPELSQKSMEAIFPWMKKTTEEKPKVEEEKEKPKENVQKQNDSVQKIDPSRIPTRDGKSTEPVSSKKLKTKPVKAKAPSKTTKQKARKQTKDSRKKQVAKLVLKPRAKLTLKVEKPTPKKKKAKPTSSKKRANPLIDLYKIFSSASPSKKPRLF